jgi:hypothetical protein
MGHWISFNQKLLALQPTFDFLEVPLDMPSDNKDFVVDGVVMGNFRDSAFEAEYSVVGDLLRSPLWSRGWIQQELIVAKKVLIICRKRFVNLKELKRAAEIAHNITMNVVAPLRNVANEYDAAFKDSGVSIYKFLDISNPMVRNGSYQFTSYELEGNNALKLSFSLFSMSLDSAKLGIQEIESLNF